MLDLEMLNQLREVFLKLDHPVILRVHPSEHADQKELVEMLTEVASTSDFIKIQFSEEKSEVPSFQIKSENQSGKILFRGIPGGHEFTSLILAILSQNGKGKVPDETIISRIRRLKGPAYLKTFMSLSCENCPEVVQSLNLIASLHPTLIHETIDGNYAQSEIETLGIQGVPSIIFEGKLIHSGKIQLLDLLRKLEEQLGFIPAETENKLLGNFDVAVIGGGPAGVSAAIYSARKGLKTAIIADRLGGQLRETKGIENMISVPYTEGLRLASQLHEHLGQYPVHVLEHRRVLGLTGNSLKQIQLESGETLTANSVIIATGAKWRELGIPGEKDYLGQGVAFCAHCDGPFYKGKKVAVVGGGNSGVEAAIDLAGIASAVTLIEYSDHLNGDQVLIDKLKSLPNATIQLNAKSTQILGDGKKVTALEFLDRKTDQLQQIPLDGVFVQIGLLPNTQSFKDLIELTPSGEIIVDAKGRTSVPGIYAAGDVTTVPFKQIIIAMGEGAKVALTAFEDQMRKETH